MKRIMRKKYQSKIISIQDSYNTTIIKLRQKVNIKIKPLLINLLDI